MSITQEETKSKTVDVVKEAKAKAKEAKAKEVEARAQVAEAKAKALAVKAQVIEAKAKEDEEKVKAPKKKRAPEEKSRYFTFLLYPESCPEDFQRRLEEVGLPMAISPLHDKDVDTVDKETGEIVYKKPHYHVIYIANNTTTPTGVRKKIQRAFGEDGKKALALVQICDNVRNLYEYLTHDSKSAIEEGKHKYDKADIVHLNNFDVARYDGNSREEKEVFMVQVWDMIGENRFCNVSQIRSYIEDNPHCGITKTMFMKLMMSNPGAINLMLNGEYQQVVAERDEAVAEALKGMNSGQAMVKGGRRWRRTR